MNKRGRKTVMTSAVVGKLEVAFLLGSSDREACLVAGISKDTLYEYCKKNPEFSDQKAALKLSPIIKAKQSLCNGLKKDPKLAFRYLQRKLPYEFGRYAHLGINEDKDEKEGLSSVDIEEINKILISEGIPLED